MEVIPLEHFPTLHTFNFLQPVITIWSIRQLRGGNDTNAIVFYHRKIMYGKRCSIIKILFIM
jgi:hypothetical protein